ncbi:MAG: NAD(P)-dependent alcohol dehydrogenase [Acidimicrobiia bacterium]
MKEDTMTSSTPDATAMSPDDQQKGHTAVNATTMQAIVQERFGGPEVLEYRTVPIPALDADRVLVHVRAASINPYDWHMIRALPYVARASTGLTKPKAPIPGADFAGVVVAVGSEVTDFEAGDEVFGGIGGGAFAEYVAVKATGIVKKPENASFAEAATAPMAGVTALQGLRDSAKLQPGQHVAVVGAAGGVGTYAVMIAKAMGAEVTAICSTRNVDMVQSIGADHVVDYTTTDFTAQGVRYDVIFDVVSTHSMADYRRALTPEGVYVSAGALDMSAWIGPFRHLGRIALGSVGRSQTMKPMLAHNSQEDLGILGSYLATGDITPVIDRSYPLDQVGDAMEYIETMHARGKVVIAVSS